MFITLTNHNSQSELIAIDSISRIVPFEGRNGEQSKVILNTGPNLHYMQTVADIHHLLTKH